MSPDELIVRMARSGVPAPSVENLEILVALMRLYGEAGLLGAEPLAALHRVCPEATECWARIAPMERPVGVGRIDAGSERGCIVLPWVGPAYRAGGVCVLGMNLRYGGADWELAMEHRIALDPKWGQHASLLAGRRAHRSNWASGTTRDVAAVRRSMRGESELDTRDRRELADALLASARVQAVKCSPIGGRSSPGPAMCRNCPPRYLRRELEVLSPSAVLAYGAPAHAALAQCGSIKVDESVDGFRRGRLHAQGATLSVFLLTHPAHGGWHAAHGALVASLGARPMGP